MITIKRFSELCNCNTRTLRYYDSIDLLKPVKVDEVNGYRYYDPEKVYDFVKIKNLQLAEFSIEEIKGLLGEDDEKILAAFDRKILEQESKMQKILEIRESYQKETMSLRESIRRLFTMPTKEEFEAIGVQLKDEILYDAKTGEKISDLDDEGGFATLNALQGKLDFVCEFLTRSEDNKEENKYIFDANSRKITEEDDDEDEMDEYEGYNVIYEYEGFQSPIDTIDKIISNLPIDQKVKVRIELTMKADMNLASFMAKLMNEVREKTGRDSADYLSDHFAVAVEIGLETKVNRLLIYSKD